MPWITDAVYTKRGTTSSLCRPPADTTRLSLITEQVISRAALTPFEYEATFQSRAQRNRPRIAHGAGRGLLH